MRWFKARSGSSKNKVVAPVIESLEGRAYMSVADLAVAVTGTLPVSVISGEVNTTKIGVNVANNGPGVAKGKVTVTLFASLDQTLDVLDAEIGPKTLGLGIKTGLNKTYQIPVKRFPQNLNGNYFIIAQVTGNGVTAASGASASTVAITPPTVNLAAQVTKVATKGRVGKSINVSVLVTDNGNVKAKGTLDVAFSASPNADGSVPFSLGTISKRINIAAGKQTTLHIKVPLAVGMPTGNQYIVATVDPANVFLDPSLGDNTNVSTSPVGVV